MTTDDMSKIITIAPDITWDQIRDHPFLDDHQIFRLVGPAMRAADGTVHDERYFPGPADQIRPRRGGPRHADLTDDDVREAQVTLQVFIDAFPGHEFSGNLLADPFFGGHPGQWRFAMAGRKVVLERSRIAWDAIGEGR